VSELLRRNSVRGGKLGIGKAGVGEVGRIGGGGRVVSYLSASSPRIPYEDCKLTLNSASEPNSQKDQHLQLEQEHP